MKKEKLKELKEIEKITGGVEASRIKDDYGEGDSIRLEGQGLTDMDTESTSSMAVAKKYKDGMKAYKAPRGIIRNH